MNMEYGHDNIRNINYEAIIGYVMLSIGIIFLLMALGVLK